jgi:hypothetical protein
MTTVADAEKPRTSTTERVSPAQTTASGEPLLVRFEKGDALDPHQWPAWKRYWCVGFASWLNVLVCIGASGYSTGAVGIGESFGAAPEVVTLGLSLYVVRVAVWGVRRRGG